MYFIPIYLYDYLIELGKITLTAKEKWDYYNKAIQVKTDQLKQDISNRKDLKHFLKMVQDGLLGAEKQSIINLSKRMIIYDYLKSKKFP
jgi:phosphoglycerate-specific signal transduction histidine kinase